MKLIKTIILFGLSLQVVSQVVNDPIKIIKEKAIPIVNLMELSSPIYDVISEYDIIMMGEMHGTNEPAEFVFGLCELITKNENNVVLALEIPSKLMGHITPNMSKEQLKKLEFFKNENIDGRNGEAWLELIRKCSQNTNIILKFIDNNNVTPRDSSMYLDLVKIRQLYPKTKIITLTGNIHNWLKPFKEQLKVGGYIIKDSINFHDNRVMSITHMYNEGTMMNNTGNGLELKEIKGKDNFLNNTIEANMYLSPRLFENQNQYTHILYTKQVTHSDKLKFH